MASITKRVTSKSDGTSAVRYDVQVKRKGGKRKTKTFKTLDTAKRWARETEAAIDKGAWVDTDLADRTSIHQVVTWYVDEVSPTLKAGNRDSSPAARLIERLGAFSVGTLEPRHLATYRDERLKDKVKPKSVSKAARANRPNVGARSVVAELGLLQRAMKHAAQEKGIPLPRGLPTMLVKKPRLNDGRDRRLSKAEYELLLLEAAKGSHFLASLIVIAVETAMRKSEILRLKWGQINLEKRFIEIALGKSKNGQPRRAALSSRALQALNSLPREQDSTGVFEDFSTDVLERQWRKARSKAGLEDVHFHDLRHEGVSRLFERGLNMIEVASISGHKTMQQLKRYAHLSPNSISDRLG